MDGGGLTGSYGVKEAEVSRRLEEAFFFSSRRRHTIFDCDWSSDVCSSDLVHFGFVGSPNEFHLFPDQVGQKGGTTWRSYGGHRLWHSPEANPRSYQPDNSPITDRKSVVVGKECRSRWSPNH